MKTFWIIVVVLVMGLLLVGAAQNKKTQWEYAYYAEINENYVWETSQEKISGSKEDFTRLVGCEESKYNTILFMNYAGKQGWEFCQILPNSQEPVVYYYFKRPR